MFGRKRNQQTDPWGLFEGLVARDWDSLLPWERRLLALGYLRQEVNSGGFNGYLVNGYGRLALDAIAAAEAVEQPELAALTRRALHSLNGADPSDIDACQEAVDALEDDEEFEALDEEFYALEQRVDLDGAMRLLVPDPQG